MDLSYWYVKGAMTFTVFRIAVKGDLHNMFLWRDRGCIPGLSSARGIHD